MSPSSLDLSNGSGGLHECSIHHGGKDGTASHTDDTSCLHCQKRALSSWPPDTHLISLFQRVPRDWKRVSRCVAAAVKSFAIGTSIKGGLSLFAILSKIGRSKLTISARDAVVEALKETLRYGLFLGAFAAIFVSVEECMIALGGQHRTVSWRAFIAGAIAGPSMLLTGHDRQHTSLAMYILMRASVLACRCGIKSKRFGVICKPLTWSYGDIFLMCLSSSQILSAYILKQDSLPPSYMSFLNKHGGKDLIILQGVKEIAKGIPLSNLKGIKDYYKTHGHKINLIREMKVPCSIVHPNQSCIKHGFTFILQAYRKALRVYLPVYLIPALIVHRQGLIKRPYTIFVKGMLGMARSSLFLSLYCSSAWIWTCLLFKIYKKCNTSMIALGTFPAGLALLIEKKSRRIEISLYCLSRALECFIKWMSDIGYLTWGRQLKRMDVATFSLSTAVIMHCYAQEREVFRSKYLNVLDWVFGVPTAYEKLSSERVHLEHVS